MVNENADKLKAIADQLPYASPYGLQNLARSLRAIASDLEIGEVVQRQEVTRCRKGHARVQGSSLEFCFSCYSGR